MDAERRLRALAIRAREIAPELKIVLHAGTPKTGKTALQQMLLRNAVSLADEGVWCAPSWIDAQSGNHKFLPKLLVAGDGAGIADAFDRIVAELPARTRVLLLSTEGVYDRWRAFPPRSKDVVRALADAFHFEMWVCFREPEAFALALYAQHLVNPFSGSAGLEEMLASEHFACHLDYLGFVREAELLVGARNVRLFRYGDDIVTRLVAALGVRLLPQAPTRANRTLRQPGIDALRVVNRYALSKREKRAAVALIRDLDALLGDRAEPLRASAAAQRRIAELSATGWAEILRIIALGETG